MEKPKGSQRGAENIQRTTLFQIQLIKRIQTKSLNSLFELIRVATANDLEVHCISIFRTIN